MSHDHCPHCHAPISPRAIAKDAGETFYRPYEPCAKCGTFERYTASGNCVKCHTLRNRRKLSESND